MDRPLEQKVIRTRRLRRGIIGLGVTALAAVFFILLTGWIRPTVSREKLKVARAEVGPVESTVMASGLVVPEHEQVIASAVDTRVLEVLKQPGSPVHQGDELVRLDVAATRVALEKMEDELVIKENQQKQVQIDLESDLIDLESTRRVKELELQSLDFKLKQTRALFEKRLSSENELRQVELDRERTRIELEQITESKENARRATQNRIDGLALETAIKRKDRDEARRQFELATARADRDGVLTWVTPEVGAVIRQGEPIARIADLTSFKVEVTVSDVHRSQLVVGLPVQVRLGNDVLTGSVVRVRPKVDNGVMTLDVALDRKNDPTLRPNLRADVYIVVARKPGTIRVKRGPFVNGSGSQDIFVLRGDAAVRVAAKIGLMNFDYVEIESGVAPGETVIISDMASYQHQTRISLR